VAQPIRSDKPRVLVVEDEDDMSDLLAFNLRASGYEVRAAASAEAALAEAEAFDPDLVILDLMLPDLSGVEVCRELRRRARRRPAVLVLSAKTDEIDRVVAFEVGADDYVAKPFSMRELLLRVRARLPQPEANGTNGGRPGGEAAPAMKRFAVGPLKIDLEHYRVSVDGREVALSPLEMHLLRQLAASGGTVCSRQDLLTRVWNYEPGTSSRTVDTHVKRLRGKLGRAGMLIRTVRGRGYRLAQPEENVARGRGQ
jgi:two-component system phosphate regulon response regulator PhoB